MSSDGSWAEVGRLRAELAAERKRADEAEAERDALKVGDALLRETAEKQREHIAWLVKQRDALAAQIEAAPHGHDCIWWEMAVTAKCTCWKAADPSVRARILADVKAEAWDEGDAARRAFYRAAYDDKVSAREALALLPKNPYPHDGHGADDTCLDCEKREEQD